MSDSEQKYGEYKNNCQKFARSLAVSVCEDDDTRAQMSAFLEKQNWFGDRDHDIDLPYTGVGENVLVRSDISSENNRHKGLTWYGQKARKPDSNSPGTAPSVGGQSRLG